MRVWRLTRARYAAVAFTGFGSALAGQRWNGRGVYVVYTASSVSLAILEQLVHIERGQAPTDLVLVSATVPDDAIETLDVPLPEDWRREPPPLELSAIGNAWVREHRSLAMRVPSVVVPSEANVLINPSHPRFDEVAIGRAETVILDPPPPKIAN